MARRAFKSFRQDAVLGGVRKVSRRWSPLLNATRAILDDPITAAVRPKQFMCDAQPFVSWMIDEIARA